MESAIDYTFVLLSIFSISCFGYLYKRDTDKRKLMFIHAFVLILLHHSLNIIFPFENNYLLSNLSNLFILPMVCAFLIAALSSIFKPKNFYKVYMLFFSIFITTLIIIVIPIRWSSVTNFLITILAISVVFVTILSTLMNRQLPNLMFLSSVLAIVSVEFFKYLAFGSNFLIFFYSLAHLFLFLVFVTSRNSDCNDITPFFSLQEKLEITQKELETSKERLVKVENIFSASPHPILVIDLKGNIIEYNRATEKLYKFGKKENISGESYSKFVANKSRKKIQEILQKVCELGTITNVEFNAVDKRGHQFPAEFSVSLIKNPMGVPSGYVIITEDITTRKVMENELRRHTEDLGKLVEERTKALKDSQERLVASERLAAIGQAATMVGHDLRNPLQAIQNGIYILKKGMSKNELPENIKKTIIAMNSSIEYADNILKNLKSFTKIRDPIFAKSDINSLISEVFSLVKKPSNVKIVFDPKTLPKVEIDADMIKRVFVNLTSNAFQAMNEHGGTLTVKTKKSECFIFVSFIDTGTGISENAKERIFTAFFTTKAQGMGIGLAICKRFVELHKGTIEVESTEGEFAKFTVKLPLKNH